MLNNKERHLLVGKRLQITSNNKLQIISILDISCFGNSYIKALMH